MSNETHNNFPYSVHRQRSLTITKVILHNKIFISLSYANMNNGHIGMEGDDIIWDRKHI